MNYILHFVQDAYQSGYRPVVFNQRGTGGVPLTTARLYSATNTEDLEFVIDYLKSLYPSAHVVAVGVSLGGYVTIPSLINVVCAVCAVRKFYRVQFVESIIALLTAVHEQERL